MNETPEDKLIRHLKRSTFDDVHIANRDYCRSRRDDEYDIAAMKNILSIHGWTKDEYFAEHRVRQNWNGFSKKG